MPDEELAELIKKQQEANEALLKRLDALEKEIPTIKATQKELTKAVLQTSDTVPPAKDEGPKPLSYYLAQEMAKKKEGK